MNGYSVFVDLDGVLADFDAGVKAVLGKLPDELPPPVLWKRLATTPDFYDRLKWLPDGRELWDFVKSFKPVILTGLPRGAWAEPQKRRWCARELGQDVPVITCLSKEKAIAARPATREGTIPLLIDDRLKLQVAWETEGGVFILHTSAKASIEALQALQRDR
jgi:hypothetical protein